MQMALHQASREASPSLTLLAGRWSIGLTPNFMLTLAGKPTYTLINNYQAAFLKHFPPIYQLVPNHGYTKLIVYGIPCMQHPNSMLPTSTELYQELGTNNAHLKA